jgi:hypothetical protein
MTEALVHHPSDQIDPFLAMPIKYKDHTAHLSTQPKSLDELIDLLCQAFATNDVNIDYVHTIMNNYKGTMREWAPFVKFQPNDIMLGRKSRLIDTQSYEFALLHEMHSRKFN